MRSVGVLLALRGRAAAASRSEAFGSRSEGTLRIGEINIWILCSALLLLLPAPKEDGVGAADGASSADDGLPRRSPCLTDDILAALRESLDDGGGLTNRSLTRFGICAAPGDRTDSLLELLKETSRGNWPRVLHPTAGEGLHSRVL